MQKSRVDIFHRREAEVWHGLPDKSVYYLADIYPHVAAASQEVLYTKGNPYHLLGESSGDIGSNFTVVRREYEESSPSFFNRSVDDTTNTFASNILTRYHAKTAEVDDSDFPLPVFASNNEMDASGSTAIARVIPTNPVSGMVVALAELKREGIPSLVGANTWKARTLRAREAGSEYLGYQFGWKPLVSEIRGFANTVTRSDEIVRKYEADSGKLLHRRYTFPMTIETSYEEEPDDYPSPAHQVSHWNSKGKRTKFTTIRNESWFSGAFTYYLPPVGTRERDLAIARKLYGTELTPEVVWNLTPWTWAIDWFSNIGDVVHNASRFSQDGLVMPYGYMMNRRTHRVEYVLSGARTKFGNQEVHCRQVFTTTVKQRRKATPFGFGLDPILDFSGRQWAILVALGLAKSDKDMKFE